MRLIDADAIRYDRLLKTGNKEHPLEWAVSQSAINSTPTFLPHVQHVESVGKDGSALKHGHWVEVQRIHETDHTAICECSLCGDTVWVYDGQRAWNYCPSCGAKMEVEEDG